MRGYRVLSFGAGTGKLAYTFLVGDRLVQWRNSRRASLSEDAARQFARHWISVLKPDVVVTEDTTRARHKGQRTKLVVAAVFNEANDQRILTVSVPRPRHYPNKHVEAVALAERFPELQPWVPKPRRLWDGEPREVAVFEALALAMAVIEKSGERG